MAAEAVRVAVGWPARVAAAIVLLNLFDCLFTLVFLQLGLCDEANPFMCALYVTSPWLFAAVKLVSVNVALAFLLKVRARPLARAALGLAAVVYLALGAYELHALVNHLAQT